MSLRARIGSGRAAAWVVVAGLAAASASTSASGRGPQGGAKSPAEVEACVARVKEFHGGGGPWAVVGYRMGERAIRTLGLPRQSFALSVVHKAPRQVQYTCMADGLQAATGASVGKMNLRIEEAPRPGLSTTVVDRRSGRRLRFTIDPDLAASIADLPLDRLEAEGRRVAALPDDRLFQVVSEVDDGPPAPAGPRIPD